MRAKNTRIWSFSGRSWYFARSLWGMIPPGGLGVVTAMSRSRPVTGEPDTPGWGSPNKFLGNTRGYDYYGGWHSA